MVQSIEDLKKRISFERAHQLVINDAICFYYPGYESEIDATFKRPYLSNFWEEPIRTSIFTLNNVAKEYTFGSCEALYHALLHRSPQRFAGVSPDEALDLSRRQEGYNTISTADRHKCMKVAVREKFMERSMRDRLISTHPCMLVERVPKHAGRPEPRWGVDSEGHGHNLLGPVLMYERSKMVTGKKHDLDLLTEDVDTAMTSGGGTADIPPRWVSYTMNIGHKTSMIHPSKGTVVGLEPVKPVPQAEGMKAASSSDAGTVIKKHEAGERDKTADKGDSKQRAEPEIGEKGEDH